MNAKMRSTICKLKNTSYLQNACRTCPYAGSFSDKIPIKIGCAIKYQPDDIVILNLKKLVGKMIF